MRSRNQSDLVPAFLCIRWAKCRFVLAQGSAFGECTSSSCQARWCTKYTNRVGVSLLDCAKGRWRGCNNLICFVALTTPMSLLGRKLCQQWLPQFLSLISVVQNVSRRDYCSLSLWFFKTKQNGMIYKKQNPQPSSGCGFCWLLKFVGCRYSFRTFKVWR